MIQFPIISQAILMGHPRSYSSRGAHQDLDHHCPPGGTHLRCILRLSPSSHLSHWPSCSLDIHLQQG